MSVTVYDVNDRIEIKIGEIVFTVSPMTRKQKAHIIAMSTSRDRGEDVANMYESTFLYIKYCVKSVKGIKDSNGDDYKLKFDEDGGLSDRSADALLNINVSSPLLSYLENFMIAIPDKPIDAFGKVIKGIEILKPKDSKKKKATGK